MKAGPSFGLSCALALLAAASLTALEPTPPSAPVQAGAAPAQPAAVSLLPVDLQLSLRFGVCRFRVADFNPRMQTLAYTIPLLILDRLEGIAEHVFTGAERLAWAERLVEDWRIARLVEQDRLWRQRDTAWLRGQETERAAAEAAGQTLAERVRTLLAEGPAAYIPSPDRPLKPGELHEKGELYPLSAGDQALFARKHGLHFIVYGSIEELGEGIIGIELAVYNAVSGREVVRASVPGRTEDAERLASEAAAECASALLGRRWGSLDLRVDPAEARIRINGQPGGVGMLRAPFQAPGHLSIEIDCEGYLPLSEEIELEPGGLVENRYRLAPRRVEALDLSSDPEPATVYIGAVKAGETPFAGSVEGAPSIGLFRKEGYHSLLFITPGSEFGPANPARMVPDIIGWKERVERKRSDFYSAFGWFLVSLPLPVLLYGFYENVVLGYNQSRLNPGSASAAELDRMVESGKYLYYAYYGGVFLSGSLLFNAAIRLMDYLGVVEQSRLNP